MNLHPSQLENSLLLLKEAKKGDPQALNALLSRYFDRVLRIVRSRMGKKLRGMQDSMDIAQNAMIRVIQGIGRFEPNSEGALIQWMSKLVENEIRDLVDYYGSKKRHAEKEVPILPSSPSHPGLASVLPNLAEKSPSQQLALKEEVLVLEEALDRLGEKKEVILLRDYAGLTFKEMGKELKISENAARMQYVRAMNKLTDIIGKKTLPSHAGG